MIYIVIPVFNRCNLTRQCLLCIKKQTYTNYKIVVVNDGSTDDTELMLTNEFPEVMIVQGDGNLWWTGAMNKGVKKVLKIGNLEGDYILSLNNDLVLDSDYLQELVNAVVDNPNAVIGSVSLNYNYPYNVIFEGANWNKYTAKHVSLAPSGIYYIDILKKGLVIPTDLLPGRGTIFPLKIFCKIGLFDFDNFPHYAADEDFSLQCRNAGYKLLIASKAKVYMHIETTGASRINTKSKELLKETISSIKSKVNLLVRYRWAKKNAPIPKLYFVLDLGRILFGKYLKRNFINSLKLVLKRSYVKYILKYQLPVQLNTIKNESSYFDSVVNIDTTLIGGNKIYVVFNADDLSPYHLNTTQANKLLIKLNLLLNQFPKLGVTLFTIPQFILNDQQYNTASKKYLIDSVENACWLEDIKKLIEQYNIEIAAHGLYHRQFENLKFFRNLEFAFLDFSKAEKRIEDALKVFSNAGIEINGFRPPGWGLNSAYQFSKLPSIKKMDYVGVSSFDGGYNHNGEALSVYQPSLINGHLINFPDTVNLDLDIDTIKIGIRRIVENNGIISIKAHITENREISNSLCDENFNKLIAILEYLSAEYDNRIEFITFAQLAKKIKKSEAGINH